jgi:hypothetical protein
MSVNHSLRLFQIVSKYIPPDDSRELINEVEAVVRNQMQMETNSLATKYELLQVKEELKSEIKTMEIRMEAGFKDLLKWIIMLMLGFSSLIIAVIKFL